MIIDGFKPMLATNADLTRLKYPLLASPKFDGIRCIVLDGKALTRNLKQIPNDYVRALLETYCDGLDGELVLGDPTAKDCFQKTTSAVMSEDGTPTVFFHVFDCVDASAQVTFEERVQLAGEQVEEIDLPVVQVVTHTVVNSQEELNAYESAKVEEGWEGVMLRDPDGVYKHGRSTVKEGGLLKVKRFADAEAVVVGFEERMHNGNAATVDALGHIERSTHKANKIGLGDLGALVVRPVSGPMNIATFTIGTGFTATQRVELWGQRNQLIGKTITFKYQEVGSKDAPRFPVFKGWREVGT